MISKKSKRILLVLGLWTAVSVACRSAGQNILRERADQPLAASPVAGDVIPDTSGGSVLPEILQSSTPPSLPDTSVGQATPSATLLPSPTATPHLRQLIDGGCCPQPFWSLDGQQILFLDRPVPDAPAAIWGVSREGGPITSRIEKIGLYSPDLQYRAYLQSGQTVVERLTDSQQWIIPSGGRAISFSPDGSQVAWTAGQPGPPFDVALREVWVSNIEGSQARPVFYSIGGGFAGWFPDGRLLVNGRSEDPGEEQVIWALTAGESPEDSRRVEVVRGDRLRGLSLSPGGNWLAYQVTLAENPKENGLWVVDTRSGQKERLVLFGSYRWRDDQSLLVVPLDLNQYSHQLWQVDVAARQTYALTDPTVTPFRISNGDWSVSPDGSAVVFVSAEGQNLWLLSLSENP